jgi:hypothetical protein
MTRFSGVYARDWKRIATATKEAAGWQCIRCGAAHQSGRGTILTVHHLDGDKSNNAWWNLLALCQRCHLSIQARVIPERPWLLAHSPWFVPYVGGFYAAYYGSADVTRTNVEANPADFLRLGQPWRREFPEVHA